MVYRFKSALTHCRDDNGQRRGGPETPSAGRTLNVSITFVLTPGAEMITGETLIEVAAMFPPERGKISKQSPMTTIQLPDGLFDEVEETAKAEGRNIADVLSEVFKRYTDDQGRQRLRAAGETTWHYRS